jgi:hypothetical protein
VADVLADCEAQLKAHSKLRDYSRIPRSEPRRSGPQPRLRSSRWAAAAAVLLLLLGGLGLTEATGVTNFRGTVIRLFSPEGTLVVEVDDPGVSVKIDESDIVITGAGAKEIRLKPGSYTVEARKDGKLVSRELVTVTKNGKQVVRVSQEPVTVPKTYAENKDPDRRAAEYVLSVGGVVRVNGQYKDIKAAADLPGNSFRLTGVIFWNADGNQVTVPDAGLAVLKDCKNLTGIDLRFTQVGDDGLVHFKDCKNLTLLDLNSTKVTDAGLVHFKDCTALETLTLPHTAVTDAGLTYFKDCKNLVALDLNDCTKVTDAGLLPFKECKNMRLFGLYHTGVTDATLARFKDYKNVDFVLNLHGTQVTDAGLANLKDCGKMSVLELEETQVTDAGLAHLKDCKALAELSLGGTKAGDAGLANFKGMPLRRLSIHNTAITDLTPLQDMPLEDIRLTPKNLTKGLDILRDMKGLKTIGITWNQSWPAAKFWERYDKGEFKE